MSIKGSSTQERPILEDGMNQNLSRLLTAGGAALMAPCLAEGAIISIDQSYTSDSPTPIVINGLTPSGPEQLGLRLSADNVFMQGLSGPLLSTSGTSGVQRFLTGDSFGPSTTTDWSANEELVVGNKGKVGSFSGNPQGWVGFRIPTGGTDYIYGGVLLDSVQSWYDVSLGTYHSALHVDKVQLADVANTAVTFGTDGGGSAVPEPSTFGLMALGAAGLAALRARRK